MSGPLARPPARLGVLTSFGAAPRSPPVPSGPSGALHTGGAWSLMCGSVRRLEARPGPAAAHGRRGQALLRPSHRRCLVRINFARNSPMAVSNSEFRSLELQRFGTLLNVHPIELRASFLVSGLVATCGCRGYFA